MGAQPKSSQTFSLKLKTQKSKEGIEMMQNTNEKNFETALIELDNVGAFATAETLQNFLNKTETLLLNPEQAEMRGFASGVLAAKRMR